MTLTGEALELLADLATAYNAALLRERAAAQAKGEVRDRIIEVLREGATREVTVAGNKLLVTTMLTRTIPLRLAEQVLSAEVFNNLVQEKAAVVLRVTPERVGT